MYLCFDWSQKLLEPVAERIVGYSVPLWPGQSQLKNSSDSGFISFRYIRPAFDTASNMASQTDCGV